MNRSLPVIVVLGAFAGIASAQSSVTVFGVIDESVNRITNNGKTVTQMESNEMASNRLGLRGSEDLGGGLAAGIWLEAAMANEAGTVGTASGTFFNRGSYVNLKGSFGELRVGHDYTPSFWNVVFGDVFGANGLGTGANLGNATMGSNAGTFVRANNMIQYFLPGGLRGVYGQLSYALGQNQPGNRYVGGRLGFAAGPVDVAIAYGDTKTQTSNDFKVFNVGGSYNFGMATLYGLYNQNSWGSAKDSLYELSVNVPVGPGQVKASYGHSSLSGLNDLHTNFNGSSASLWGVQYIYSLSRSTALYAGYGHVSNTGPQAAFTVEANGYSAQNATSSGVNAGFKLAF